MRFALNRLFSESSRRLGGRPLKTSLEVLMFVWIAFIGNLYCYYYFGSVLVGLFAVATAGLIWLNAKINPGLFDKVIRPLAGNRTIKVRFIYLPLIFLAASWLMANAMAIAFGTPWEQGLSGLWKTEYSLVSKLSAIMVFYLAFFLLIHAWGKKILSFFHITFSSPAENSLFSLGLGFAPLMLITLFLAAAGLLSAGIIWAVTALAAILVRREIFNSGRKLLNASINIRFADSRFLLPLAVFMILLFSLAFNYVSIIKPIPITTDDLHTYFAAPSLYTAYHQYKPLRHCETANMGQNTEMIYSAIMAATGSFFIIHFQFFSFCLCLTGLYLLLRKIFNATFAVISLLSVGLIPWNAYYLSTVKVEFFLAFYSLLMAYLTWLYCRTKEKNYVLLLGVFSGLSLGIKYTAGFLIVPLYLVILLCAAESGCGRQGFRLKHLLVSVLMLIVFFSPWAIKNYVYFNNPLFPYWQYAGQKNLNSLAVDPYYKKQRAREINIIRHAQAAEHRLFGFARTLWNQSLGKNTDRGHWINFGFIPLLVIPFYFFFLRTKRAGLVLAVPLLYILLWFGLEGSRPWYGFFGIIMLYALLPILLLRRRIIFYLYFSFALCIVFLNTFILKMNSEYLFGKISGSEYIEKAIPYYRTARFINGLNLNSREKILLAGDLRTAFIDRHDELTYVDPYLAKLSYALNQGDDYFTHNLTSAGFNYIIYSQIIDDFYFTWLTKNNISLAEYLENYDGRIPSLYQDIESLKKYLNKNAVLVFTDGYYHLYKINGQ